MKKTLALSLILAASMGLAACNKAPEVANVADNAVSDVAADAANVSGDAMNAAANVADSAANVADSAANVAGSAVNAAAEATANKM